MSIRTLPNEIGAPAGLGGVITSASSDPNGGYDLDMGTDDFTTLYGNTQEYFQSCGCQDLANLLQIWADSVTQSNARLVVGTAVSLLQGPRVNRSNGHSR